MIISSPFSLFLLSMRVYHKRILLLTFIYLYSMVMETIPEYISIIVTWFHLPFLPPSFPQLTGRRASGSKVFGSDSLSLSPQFSWVPGTGCLARETSAFWAVSHGCSQGQLVVVARSSFVSSWFYLQWLDQWGPDIRRTWSWDMCGFWLCICVTATDFGGWRWAIWHYFSSSLHAWWDSLVRVNSNKTLRFTWQWDLFSDLNGQHGWHCRYLI